MGCGALGVIRVQGPDKEYLTLEIPEPSTWNKIILSKLMLQSPSTGKSIAGAALYL